MFVSFPRLIDQGSTLNQAERLAIRAHGNNSPLPHTVTERWAAELIDYFVESPLCWFPRLQ